AWAGGDNVNGTTERTHGTCSSAYREPTSPASVRASTEAATVETDPEVRPHHPPPMPRVISRLVSLAATAMAAVAPAVVALPAGAYTLAAQAPGAHFPTNEDLRHTRTLGDPRLSPDGQSVLFTVTEPTADSAARHLWIADVGGAARQLTAGGNRGEGEGRWSPDGKAVYFTAKRGEHTRLFRLP